MRSCVTDSIPVCGINMYEINHEAMSSLMALLLFCDARCDVLFNILYLLLTFNLNMSISKECFKIQLSNQAKR